MKRSIQVYRFNTGSCGGCDLEIGAAISAVTDIGWAATPQEANVLLITGPLTPGAKAALVALMRDSGNHAPILAVGRCAIDGRPFGRGGVTGTSELIVHSSLDGCPPTPSQIIEAIRRVAAGD
ncbi:MAG: NADH:ubiquinone oxidoreductase [Roseiflexus sp.]|nr:NADH:ubiquinone oxidoreductase [Roseiflexus sp.]MCS7287949.1 NADH:ubiquinone oxidoreductase [Roseiflexus sp.]MDW8148882.1 NADH:ubiquinone oxidoreductase [Roseiflexaceae bacterium]MDW8233927.1 NADH:ubiquinone oxidoreductase [Roseiflexaceae bacterium]